MALLSACAGYSFVFPNLIVWLCLAAAAPACAQAGRSRLAGSRRQGQQGSCRGNGRWNSSRFEWERVNSVRLNLTLQRATTLQLCNFRFAWLLLGLASDCCLPLLWWAPCCSVNITWLVQELSRADGGGDRRDGREEPVPQGHVGLRTTPTPGHVWVCTCRDYSSMAACHGQCQQGSSSTMSLAMPGLGPALGCSTADVAWARATGGRKVPWLLAFETGKRGCLSCSCNV